MVVPLGSKLLDPGVLAVALVMLANVSPASTFLVPPTTCIIGARYMRAPSPACRPLQMCSEGGAGKKVEDGPAAERPSSLSSSSDSEPQISRVTRVEDEKVDPITFVFGKPGEFDRDLKMMGTSRRRFLGLNLFALAFAFFANFAGMTSWALGLLPGLDGLYLLPPDLTLFYPVKGWKRYKGEGAYEFIYPQAWLADQAVTFANSAKGQQDQLMAMQRKRVAPLVSTSVAFGPPRGDSSENVSVVRSQLPTSFTLRGTLGEPAIAAQRLLDSAIAPPGSGKQARLVKAFGEMRGGSEVYQFEYVVTLKDGRTLHNACAIMDKDAVLYTLTVLCPEEAWATKSDQLLQVAASFKKV